ESLQAANSVLIKKRNGAYFNGHSDNMAYDPAVGWPPSFPFLWLFPRKRLFERCGLVSPVRGSDLACLGAVSVGRDGLAACLGPPFFFASGRRLFLPDLRFFLFRSSSRVRLSWPTT